jgi:hypothetical protein
MRCCVAFSLTTGWTGIDGLLERTRTHYRPQAAISHERCGLCAASIFASGLGSRSWHTHGTRPNWPVWRFQVDTAASYHFIRTTGSRWLHRLRAGTAYHSQAHIITLIRTVRTAHRFLDCTGSRVLPYVFHTLMHDRHPQHTDTLNRIMGW